LSGEGEVEDVPRCASRGYEEESEGMKGEFGVAVVAQKWERGYSKILEGSEGEGM